MDSFLYPPRCYLGFDFSTQQLKALATDNDLKVICEASVHFDTDLPEFRTKGGVHIDKDKQTITAPPLMWAKAIDLIMDKLKLAGLDFLSVVAISGAGQQHGSVFWKTGALETLKNLKSDKFLYEQLQGCFSLQSSPVWMDSSTTPECLNLEEKIGGAQELANITGSRAFERLTGNQIAKVVNTKLDVYNMTERISLVSNFASSLFLGDYTGIDLCDGSGMNLLDINMLNWCPRCCDICGGGDLINKLGELASESRLNLGPLSDYFKERYGFSSDCSVIKFTGDNPASMAGLGLRPTDIAVSLGTSDTVLMGIQSPIPNTIASIMINPINPECYMAMLCYKNGSLTRERIRGECAEGSWELFNELLESTPRGNFGNIGLYFDLLEITPPLNGDYKFNKLKGKVSKFSKEVEVRAVVEGQFVAKRAHCEMLGFSMNKDTRIIATGGASVNHSILQVLADVFGLPVYTQDASNSVCMGSVYRAKCGSLEDTPEQQNYEEMFKDVGRFNLIATPNKDCRSVYDPMVKRYKLIEETLLKSVANKNNR